MRILLDHDVPQPLRHRLQDHEVHTAAYRGWDGLRNGHLLEAAAGAGYDLLITCEQRMRHQQNLSQYDITVVTVMGVAGPTSGKTSTSSLTLSQ
ncbi:MAG: hypothetical protein F4X66_04615 [Chloroflexi bacterium]|nr:hypothetical protein [Chloroflexota bacterium]